MSYPTTPSSVFGGTPALVSQRADHLIQHTRRWPVSCRVRLASKQSQIGNEPITVELPGHRDRESAQHVSHDLQIVDVAGIHGPSPSDESKGD